MVARRHAWLIGNIRTAELLPPRSHVSSSLFEHFTPYNIVARLHSQITLGHKPLPDQHLDTCSLHSPTGRVSCADDEGRRLRILER